MRLRSINAYYGRIQALKGVSLHILPGEVVCLIGANGAGKTTTLRAISGLMERLEGQVTFEETDLSGRPPEEIVRMGISHAPEGRQLFAPLSVMDNLRLGAYQRYRDAGKAEIERDVEAMFDLFPGIRARASNPAGTLSGGEQQMLTIARALMAKPKLLLLDEPSMGLAPLVTREIFDAIDRLRVEEITVLLVEQNARMALRTADRGYVLETGKVVLEGSAEELLGNSEVQRAYLGTARGGFLE